MKGSLCDNCRRFKADTAVILQLGQGPLGLCVHHKPGDPMVRNEWSQRTSWECGTRGLASEGPVRRNGAHVPPEVKLPASGIRSCRSWMNQFAPHMPEGHDPRGSETMVDILSLQIRGVTEKVEEIEDSLVGLAPSIALLWSCGSCSCGT